MKIQTIAADDAHRNTCHLVPIYSHQVALNEPSNHQNQFDNAKLWLFHQLEWNYIASSCISSDQSQKRSRALACLFIFVFFFVWSFVFEEVSNKNNNFLTDVLIFCSAQIYEIMWLLSELLGCSVKLSKIIGIIFIGAKRRETWKRLLLSWLKLPS